MSMHTSSRARMAMHLSQRHRRHPNTALFQKYYSNFSSDTFENIIILSIDEVLNKKFKIDLDEEQFKMVLQLVKNSYLFKTAYVYIKDILIKIYTKCKCRSCYNVDDVDIKLDISKHPNL